MRKGLLRSALLSAAALAALSLAGTGVAQAGATYGYTYYNNFNVNIWNYTCDNCKIGDNSQKALPSNPSATSGNLVATGTYKGPMNFGLSKGGTDKIGAFFNSSNPTGTLTLTTGDSSALNDTLSTGSYNSGANQKTTLMEFTFTAYRGLSAKITHDDGMSLWQSGSLVVPTSSQTSQKSYYPTSAKSTFYTIKKGYTYNLWYLEANGLPAELNFATTRDTASNVPEPGSLALLGTGLLGLGLIGRRRRRKA